MSKFNKGVTNIKCEDKPFLQEAIKRTWKLLWNITLQDKDIEFHDPWVEEKETVQGKVSVPHIGRPLYGYQGDQRDEEANVIVRRKNMPHLFNDWGMYLDGDSYSAHEQDHRRQELTQASGMIKAIVSTLKIEKLYKELLQRTPDVIFTIDGVEIKDFAELSAAVQKGMLEGKHPVLGAKRPKRQTLTGFEGVGGLPGSSGPGTGGSKSKPKSKETY